MSILQEVKDYALDNYTKGGWDVVVECYTDEELAKELEGANTLEEALQMLRPLVGVWAERQMEADYQKTESGGD